MLIVIIPSFTLLILKRVNVVVNVVFNLMSGTNQTTNKWHETFNCKCRLDALVCNKKQRWNKNKSRCECKELIDKEYMIKDLFGIQRIVSVNVIKRWRIFRLWKL